MGLWGGEALGGGGTHAESQGLDAAATGRAGTVGGQWLGAGTLSEEEFRQRRHRDSGQKWH